MNIISAAKRDRKLKRKLIVTVLVLLVSRILYAVPVPGVDMDYFQSLVSSDSAFAFLNLVSGNGFSRLTLAALGITPFITATIITQLMSVVIPPLQEISKQRTKSDRDLMDKINYTLGGVIAVIESVGLALTFGKNGLLTQNTSAEICVVTLAWTASAVIISLLGKMITDHGIGNGISLILLMNIVSAYPSNLSSIRSAFIDPRKGMGEKAGAAALVLFVVILTFAVTYYIQEAEKRIPILYSQNSTGKDSAGRKYDYLPIKMCPGSVIPVIFAGSVFSFPVMIARAVGKSGSGFVQYLNTASWFNKAEMKYTAGVFFYIGLIFFFTFFYNDVTNSPIDLDDRLQKRSGIIAGCRPGKETADYIKKETKGMLLKGSLIMSLISVFPMFIGGYFGITNLSLLGTSVLIITGVCIEFYRTLYAAECPGLERKHLEKGGLLSQAWKGEKKNG